MYKSPEVLKVMHLHQAIQNIKVCGYKLAFIDLAHISYKNFLKEQILKHEFANSGKDYKDYLKFCFLQSKCWIRAFLCSDFWNTHTHTHRSD